MNIVKYKGEKRMTRCTFRKLMLLSVLLAMVCSIAFAGASSLSEVPAGAGRQKENGMMTGSNPEVILEVNTRIAAVKQDITFSYKSQNIGNLDMPYAQWKIYEWKNGASELVNFAIPWFSDSGPVLGTSGKETFKVKDAAVEAVTIEILLVDYDTVVKTTRATILIGTPPKAVTGLMSNGTAQKLVTEGTVKNGRVFYAVTTEKTEPLEDQFTTEIPTAINAGTYYVWYEAVSNTISGTGHTAACVTAVILDPSNLTGKVTVSGGVYQLDHDKMTATFVKPKSKSARKLTIPATVNANNAEYKVTEIKAKACKGMSKLSALVIGENVVKIGSSAFENCSQLKTITMKTAELTAKGIGKNAFRTGCAKKTTVKCPKDKANDYKKIFTGKGLPKKNSKFTE